MFLRALSLESAAFSLSLSHSLAALSFLLAPVPVQGRNGSEITDAGPIRQPAGKEGRGK